MYIWEKPLNLLYKYIIKMPKVKNKKTLTPRLDEVTVKDIAWDLEICLCVSDDKKYYSYQSTMHFPINFFWDLLVSVLCSDSLKCLMDTNYHQNICPDNIPHHHYNLIYIRCGDYWFVKSVKLCLFQYLTQSGQHKTGLNEFQFLEREWLSSVP